MDTDSYRIILTDFAKEEINDIFEYISKILRNKLAAYTLMNGIERNLLGLKLNPYLATQIHIKPRDEIYRRMIFNNYIILYQVNENARQIVVYRVLYGRRDYLSF